MDAAKYQQDTAAAYDEAGVVAGKATLYALAGAARAEHPTARIVVLSASDQGDWCIVDYVVTDEDDLADVEDLENDDGLASCLYTDVWRLRELYAQYDVRGQIEYSDRMGLTSFRMDVAKVLAECAPPEPEPEPEPDYKALFAGLFRDICAVEAPHGSQVDDVLSTYQDAYDKAKPVAS